MLSFGMVVGKPELIFYTDPKEAMEKAAKWINGLRKIGRPAFLAAPAVWDGMFIHWYFVKFLGKSPFSQTGSGIDLRSYWMGLTGGEWRETHKGIRQTTDRRNY